MTNDDLILFVDSQFISPYAMVVFVALHEKGLPFKIEKVDLVARDNYQASYVNLSVTSRVPTLVHGQYSLSESSAITEYLDEAFPGVPLYPQALQDKARARQIQAWLRSDLAALRDERPTETVFYGAQQPALSEAGEQAAHKFLSAVEPMLTNSSGSLFDNWSVVDVDLTVMIHRLLRAGDSVPDRVAAYAKHQWRRPTVLRWLEQSSPPI